MWPEAKPFRWSLHFVESTSRCALPLCRVLSAEVHGLQPAAHDKTLFPSDHAAIKATLEVSRKLPVDLQAASSSRAIGGGGGKGGGVAGQSSL